MQSFPKQKKKKRSKKKEPERPSIMHSRESGTCYLCMKRGRELLKTGSAAGKSL